MTLSDVAQVISGDESGTVCMWNIHTGAREGNFKRCHGSGRLTAMTLDAQVCFLAATKSYPGAPWCPTTPATPSPMLRTTINTNFLMPSPSRPLRSPHYTLTHPLTAPLAHSLLHSSLQSLAQLTASLTHSLAHLVLHSLTHGSMHSITY